MRILSRDVLAAVFAGALSGLQLVMYMTFLGIKLEILGALPLIIGFAFFSRNFYQIFLRVPSGDLAQIIGRKHLITAGTGFYTISYFVMSLAKTPFVVLVSTLLVAIGMSLYWPAMFSYIGDIATDDYGKINGVIFQGSDLGVIVGTLLARYSLRNDLLDLDGLFLYGGFVGIVGTLLVFIWLPETLNEEDRSKVESIPIALWASFRNSLSSLVKMTKQIPLGIIYLFQLMISFTEYFFSSFLPLLLFLYIGMSNDEIANVVLVGTLIVFFYKPYLGKISDKFGFRKPVLVSLIVSSLSLFAFTLIQGDIGVDLYLLNLIRINFTLGFGFLVIILYVLLISASITSYLAVNGATSYAASNKDRGLAMGALGFYVSFGRSASSLILTPVWEIYERISGNRSQSIANVFRVAAIIIFVSALILYWLSKDINLEESTAK